MMIATRYKKGFMVFELYSMWIKAGRWKEVDKLYEKAFEDGRITASQYLILQKRCFRERVKEDAEKRKQAIKVGA